MKLWQALVQSPDCIVSYQFTLIGEVEYTHDQLREITSEMADKDRWQPVFKKRQPKPVEATTSSNVFDTNY
jgi:hypothetical protein